MSFVECRLWRAECARDPVTLVLPPTLCVFGRIEDARWHLPLRMHRRSSLGLYAVRTVKALNHFPEELLGATFHDVLVFAPGLRDRARTLLMCAVLPSNGGGYFEPVPVTRLPMGWRR